MKVRLDGVTSKASNFDASNIDSLKKQCGTYAGVCYMPDTYSVLEANVEGAVKRFGGTVKTGHHSITDHYFVNLVLEDAPKILAMALNNVGMYATSEKSGRYTVMSNCSAEEKVLYDKWAEKLPILIKNKYPDMPDVMVKKLAQENARYFLSVFTPATTMVFSTNIRMINYLYDWCIKFPDGDNYFEKTLKSVLMDFASQIKPFVVEGLRDYKNGGFTLFDKQMGNRYCGLFDRFGFTYQTVYLASFVSLAQAHRHRTIDYSMYFDGVATQFFVPAILETDELRDEWLNDMQSVAHLIPQGTLVKVYEMGTYTNFLLKCTERLCGRAQFETARQTLETYKKYREFIMNNVGNSHYLYNAFYNECPSKATMIRDCKEPCYFGCGTGVNFDERLI